MIRHLVAMLPAILLAGCFTQPPAPAVDRSGPVAKAPPAPAGPGYYTVRKGDTLYRIALEHGQDYRDIAAWNNLANPGSIKEGQLLRVQPPNGENAAAVVVTKPVVPASPVESRPLEKAAAVSPPADGVRREPRVNKEPYSDEAYARLGQAGEMPVKVAETRPEPKADVRGEPAPTPVSLGPDDVAWIWPANGKLLAPFSENGSRGLDIGGKAGDPVLAAGEGKVVYAGSGLRGYGQLVIVKHNNTFLSAYAHNQKILVKEGQQVAKGQKIAEMGNTDSDTVKLHFEIRRQGKPIDPIAYLPKR